MRRWNVGMISLTLLVLFMYVVPVHAQDDNEFTILLAPLNTVRYDFVYTFNGAPLQVCQAEWESWNRGHTTCRDLVSIPELNLIAGYVRETVVYDDVVYIRDNEETIWSAFANQFFNPNLSLNEGLFIITANFESVVTRLGAVTVNGVATTQYQFWSLDESLNGSGQFVYDIFVSADNFVIKDQISVRSSAEPDADEIASIWTYSSFNAPITVSRPPADRVQPASTGIDSSHTLGLRFGGRAR